MPSEVAKKIVGVFIHDSGGKGTPLLKWVQQECRSGKFSGKFKEFCDVQEEKPELCNLLVEEVTLTAVTGRIPVKVFDHEADSALSADVNFSLDLTSSLVTRTEV